MFLWFLSVFFFSVDNKDYCSAPVHEQNLSNCLASSTELCWEGIEFVCLPLVLVSFGSGESLFRVLACNLLLWQMSSHWGSPKGASLVLENITYHGVILSEWLLWLSVSAGMPLNLDIHCICETLPYTVVIYSYIEMTFVFLILYLVWK
jgi:hypothetical protein